MSNVNRALDCTITRKEPDSDSCMIFLSGTPILQVGNCCTVVEIKVNDDLVQWLENATDDSPAELDIDLGNLGICTLIWNNKERLQEKWKVELKSELSEDLSGLKNKVLKKITYLHGGVVTDIAKEFYQIFHAKLEKITPGCINMEFILEAKNTYDAKTKIEEMRKRLEIKLQDIIKDEHGRFTTTIANRSLLSRRKVYDKCTGGTCPMTAESISNYFPGEREKGIYTLLCLDGSDVSKDPGLRKTLRQLYKKILEDLDKTHCDQCVTFNEFVSLIAFGGNGKVHIEQPFQIEFPQEDAFDHVIDEVVGCDLPLDASQMLTTVFQIASKHGQRFQKEGYVIQPRIVIFTNGKFKEPESTALPVSSCDTMYPVTFVPIDQNCDKGVLKRIISNIGGEITTDIPYIARYAGHLQMFVDALKMGKRDINEILETIKEYAPDDVIFHYCHFGLCITLMVVA
ncbi:uncharacterized protein LOC125660714 isoform X2 [Ostrea edulis]|uniref:uncharacterized protein LOC125660714 isoform X2 n=1 Tax=Ostrea edulis TaxID=37623 RepID=UPI0024AF996E|nr:uncharacterized protein LOC125660714 isoform X2 [Ostrea edulis]